jgi:hypothetical protein
MGGTTKLTGGPGLPERATREGGRRESLTNGVGLSGEGGAARAAGPCGPWEERGEARERAGRARIGLAKGGGFSFFFFFFFCFLFLFFSFSIFVSFYFFFL